ncbi:hypothetical protein AGABI1DRAFT_108660 [Agaricus bisporus var. burnettii JB137-S8]|uniref:Nephrocystin 3-like N-terminal domain-containing protein n=1 Tax=Agaricus bisporus var. burnettii (strain JB137-S8 / ATCC MYA-4627 / FGSC 10392) TaxID=597362 RepID=K5X121_AGABU|nr:uncharacterized protein AGABI1DRAFT_108660 [Agaricus bisporus var. burnettii JB137-S8]EKM76567.1 hypothetical protein AGABI1DRAFT_108660 [Agaricus bisporus var. burnettii JB137-S8]
MPHEGPRSRIRRLLIPSTYDFRRFWTRVSPSPSPSPAPVQQHPKSNPPSKTDTSRLDVSIDTTSSSSTPIIQNDTPGVRLPIGPQLPTGTSSPTLSLERSIQEYSGTDQQRVNASSPSLHYPQDRSEPQYAPTNSISQGMFYQPSCSTTAAFKSNDINKSDIFMENLRKETIPGAEFDSSSRDPPSGRCRYFIINHNGKKKLRLVLGPAGVGKTSVMRSIAQEALLPGATIFFSRHNARGNGAKAITTIAYQIAAKLEPYRLFIENEVARDPFILQKPLPIHFDQFIVKPFMHQCILDSLSRLLIIIDGLDECSNSSTQLQLLRLISDFCISYPSSPVVWIIASRPEPHIMSLISQPHVKRISERDEIPIDSDEAQKDVERFLRHELEKQMALTTPRENSLRRPLDSDILKIAAFSGGLFVCASTVVRYISDPTHGDPFSQLDDILMFIENGTDSSVPGLDLPLVKLDALYTFIMSKIPAGDMVNLRKLLLLKLGNMPTKSFQVQCNILGMTQVVAYNATRYTYPIADVPEPAKAADDSLRLLHKSFADYLADPSRSRFSPDIKFDAKQLIDQCVLRIVEAAPDGGHVDGMGDNANGREFGGDALKNGSGTIDDICLSWPAVEECDCRELRKTMYRESVLWVMEGFGQGRQVFQSLFCLRMLTSCFNTLPIEFPFKALRDFAFDNSRRSQLLEHGILKQMELETLRFDEVLIEGCIRRHFRSPTDKLSEHWNTSCKHEREGKWEVYNQDWSTEFECPKEEIDSPFSCSHCYQQFTYHLKRQSPDHLITVIDLATTCRGVEFRFVDPDNGKSEWIYHFFTVERVS